MVFKSYLCIALIILSVGDESCAFLLDWFDWGRSDNHVTKLQTPEEKKIDLREDVTLISVPFEEMSNEDKFLQEAERFSSVSHSGLDTCEHRVVMKLQTSCSDINEEELAKLSIRLLNCQSEVSGRDQITCTDDMSLKECTSPMDSEMWNAYHIINNRARAVCYAIRQQQFRALSEMAVNKLMTSSLKQLTTMSSLEELQRELNLLTTNTMSSLKDHQQGLLDQSGGLRLAQKQVQDTIFTNIKQLTQEKILIQSTQDQLKTLSEKLSHELDDVEAQLESQSEQHRTAHQEILSRLADITAKTDALWTAIDKKSQQLQKQQEQVQKGTLETLQNLKRINDSVTYLLNLVNQVKAQVDEKMAWASDTIGGDGATLVSIVKHSAFLVTGVLVSLFLQLSLPYRLFLLVAVLVNVTLVYHHQPLSFSSLTAVVAGLWALTVLVSASWPVFLKKYNSKNTKKNEPSKKEVEEDLEEEDNLSTKSSIRTESISQNYNVAPIDTFSDDTSSLRYRRSTSRADSRTAGICAAMCRNGQLCRSTPTPGQRFCRRHITH